MKDERHVIDKNGSLDTDRVEEVIERMDAGRKEQTLSDFDGFKQYLHKRMEMAENIGLNEEQLAKAAEKVADYLAKNEAPRNPEERLLQELWKVGEQDERHKLAHMLVRLAQKG
ncbi:hypothetical protein J31TS4_36190 [Paenibacillus sp. J31TS4]|uniref:DUF3243 domain-containing protein n=1 Tax=Paenibacillus sp. J31TS4 TaxID=2807195 RepID=UPI001B226E61|nr:DUF3243 domain-containing protein [Paenibacillus sp. J31TS4]GIP40339.1 hypothetical protein J31TS4_36190 [Paenibacillus sp. J31TS4]